MNTETGLSNVDLRLKEFKNEVIRKIRSLDPGMEVLESENNPAGYFIDAKSNDENIPILNLMLNEINKDITIRLEAIGNITQYIIDEAISYILRNNFKLIFLEVTDPKTGLVKFSLYRKDNSSNNLFKIYKHELFKFHYPRDDGRLVLFFDQGNLWVTPVIQQRVKSSLKRPLAVRPVVSTKKVIQKKEKAIKIKEEVVIAEPDLMAKPTETTEIIEPVTKVIIKSLKDLADLSQKELTVFKLVESRPNKKVQSKGLRKDLQAMDQDAIRNILRSLVARGLLYVRSAWYIVKEDPAEDTWDIASDTPIEERLQSLNAKEKKIYDILDSRPGHKAQARMLVKETKMTKDNLKKLLRNMVAKDVLFVYAAWYCLKE